MTTQLPNFLIVGAAKCGTSSLHNYLAQHPQVFMSKVKEPRFISSQFSSFPLNGPKDHRVESWYVKDYENYVKLFTASQGFKAIGESSADTIYFYKKSIPVIKEYLNNPKIIIVLRNPIKRAFSAYQHLLRDEREKLTFEEGLKEEANRIKNNWELIYHYTSVSKYFESVKAFKDNFTSVKIVLNEDMETKPQEVLKDIFRFLDIDPDFVINSELRYNVSGKPKSQWLHQFLFEGNKMREFVRPVIRYFFSHETRKKISYKIQEKNLTQLKINADTRKMLLNTFRDDIVKLQSIIPNDLSAWLKE